ncbi:MAG: hypothetical protein JXA66_03305 [Oligoflexia bacterium]|nr:hypothetical protein [Oligoflexia bacterium]
MTDSILIISALLMLVAGFIKENIYQKITALFLTFSLLTIITVSDVLHIFFYIINGFIVHLILMAGYKEYEKK